MIRIPVCRRPAVIFFFFVIIANNISAQFGPGVKWQKCLGGTRDEQANDVAPTPDGGYIVVGLSKSNDGDVTGHHGAVDTADGWIAKLNSAGAIEWQKSVGGTSIDYFTSIIPTSDNAYVCIGVSNSNDGDVAGNHGKGDYWAVKISNTGTILWSKCFGGSGTEIVGNGISTYDGGFAIIGETRSADGDITGYPGGSIGHLWLVKINSTGILQWQKCYATYSYSTGPGIIEEAGHNLWLGVHPGALSVDFKATNGFDGNYVKVDKDNGNVVKTIYEASRYTSGSSFVKTGKGYLAAFTNPIQYPLHTEQNSITELLDTGANTLVKMQTPSAYDGFGALRYDSWFAPWHGIAALSDTSFIGAGLLFDNGTGPTGNHSSYPDGCIGIGRFIGSSGSSPTYTYFYQKYGGTGSDQFTAVKVLAGGNDYIAVGYTNSNDFDVSGNHGGTDCWIVRLTGINSIMGNVFLDYNGNGVKDPGDADFDKVIVKSERSGLVQYAVPYHGMYQNDVDTGFYQTTVIPNKPYYTITPAAKTSYFGTYRNTDTVNFAVHPLAGKRDYTISAKPFLFFRPAASVIYNIVYTNNGTDTLVNRKLLLIKDHRSHLVQASPVNTTASGDSISWTIASLLPGASGTINVYLKLDSIPLLNMNDTVTARFYIDSTGDAYMADNVAVIRRIVTSSYDPNGKEESYGGFIEPLDVSSGKSLTYTIRFQNTGNDTAFTVIVRDTLESRLDVGSIEMTDASHPYYFNILNGKYATWTFDNIRLVDSIHNEPLSHGYLTYRIKPQSTVAIGDTIHNSASIYFDFNPAVKTPTQLTVVKAFPLVQPLVSGLLNTYCGNGGVQKARITNLPAANSGTTVTVKLDNTVLPVAADSSFGFDVNTITAAGHTITVQYNSASGMATYSYPFSVTAAVTPDVSVSANITTVVNLTDNVIITAGNAAGGGSTPLYTFAKDRTMTNILQAESGTNTLTIAPSTLVVGTNWVYVRMKTSNTCYATQTNTDSVKIDRSSVTGLVDIDNPGQVITVYPNPFKQGIGISGLSTAKTYMVVISDASGKEVYRQRVSNNSHLTTDKSLFMNGSYWLRLYDAKKNRLIGITLLIKE